MVLLTSLRHAARPKSPLPAVLPAALLTSLQKLLQLVEQLTRELNANAFYKRLVPASERSFWNIAHRCAETRESTSAVLKIRGDNDNLLSVIVDADYVDDEFGDVKCILSMRKE